MGGRTGGWAGTRAVTGREVGVLPLLYHRGDNKLALKPVRVGVAVGKGGEGIWGRDGGGQEEGLLGGG